MEHTAPSSRTVNMVSEVAKGSSGDSPNSSNHLIENDESATATTQANGEEKLVRNGPVSANQSGVSRSFQYRAQSKTSDLFTSSESMFLLQANGEGVEAAREMFHGLYPDWIGRLQGLPHKLRAIASELEGLLD